MLSRRLEWNAPQNPLAVELARFKREGVAIVDLTLSNPTRGGFEYPAAAILEALNAAAAMKYDPDPRGLLSAREAVAQDYRERGMAVQAEDVFLVSSTSEAYAHLFRLFADPGDTVLVPQPSYPLFDTLAALEGVRLAHYSAHYAGEWQIDFDSLHAADLSRVRALVWVNPNNPTGAYAKRGERRSLLAFCAQHSIPMIVDEVFSEFRHDDDAEIVSSFADWDAAENATEMEAGPLVVVLDGLSKKAGLPQMKLGWIVLAGPVGKRRALSPALEIALDAFLSPSTPIQLAAPALLHCGANVRAQIQRRCDTNLAAAREILAGSPIQPLKTEGGWSLVLQLPAIRTDEEWALELLREANVLVHPGYLFGFSLEACLAVSLIVPQPEFAGGLAEMRRWVEAEAQGLTR